MTAADLLDERAVDQLMDAPVTPLSRLLVLGLASGMSAEDRARVATLIDRSCVYVRFSASCGLVGDTPCGLEDWHALAREIR